MPSRPPTPDRHESLAERRIRQAMEAGDFDDLEGTGKPIPGIDQPYDPAWWAKKLIERERLRELFRSGNADRTRSVPDSKP